jgi:hypothetical protein
MPIDSAIRDHQSWLGYLQPDGLVVSAAALVDSQVVLDRASAALQPRFLEFVEAIPLDDKPVPAVVALEKFLCEFLGWPADCLYGFSPERLIPESLKIPLLEFGETLEPTAAFRLPQPDDPDRPWLLLVQSLEPGTHLDKPLESKLTGWAASPTHRFERLLRAAEVPIGFISNGTHLRLIYAPRGENAGTLTFPVAAMTEIGGRTILAAFQMLLKVSRLLAGPTNVRLPAILKRSREYQARVSTALAQQVLDALYELLRGFQAADDHTYGELLREVLADDPDQVYAGLLTVLMRLVFLLYAEDRALMPASDLYVRNYAVHGLFERLRADAHQYPDTMSSRYGAWAQLLALFRAVHRGCTFPLMQMPSREGHLFDPDRYPFLEGRTLSSSTSSSPSPLAGEGWGEGGTANGRPASRLPLVSDGTIFQILEKLLMLDGERLSYRTLDVEQIGSVYQTMMGFRLEPAAGASIALKPGKARGAPVPVNLDELLACSPANRAKFIQERTDYKLTAVLTNSVKAAESVDDLLAALENRIARNATPQLVAAGTMLLVPTDERRKTGSHYTPRALTEPIVRTTLEPVLKQLGKQPEPSQILNLKVCDPAMGSAAFLVEACRQLADELVKAWAAHGYNPAVPPDEDLILYARRLIAQRCLYGVDRNPLAVDLAKLSLWLATLAKDHPFTFLDHSLRAGDALVGLTRKQIVGFDLDPPAQLGFVEAKVRERMEAVARARRAILEAGDDMLPGMKQQKLAFADEQLDLVRLAGDAVVAAFFAGSTARQRKERRDEYFQLLDRWIQRADANARQQLGAIIADFRGSDLSSHNPHPITPFHWEIEFPEVFASTSPAATKQLLTTSPGFDAIIGNPPFSGVKLLGESSRPYYTDLLRDQNVDAGGKCDLVAFFFRRAHMLVRANGAVGFVATKTIAQGDTRRSGLAYLLRDGAEIYSATKRLSWPGQAAVIVSVVNFVRGASRLPCRLNGKPAIRISSYLLDSEFNGDPEQLRGSTGLGFLGSKLLGMGFIFDDDSSACPPMSKLGEILALHPESTRVIKPYVGGEMLNAMPQPAYAKFVVDFGTMDHPQASHYSEVMAVLAAYVRPQRNKSTGSTRERWWQYAHRATQLYDTIGKLQRFLVLAQYSETFGFAFLPTGGIINSKLIGFATDKMSRFAVLQSRIHETWARLLSGTLKDDLQYTPSACLVTFPFPEWQAVEEELESVGSDAYHFRAALMVKNNEGLTKTYNRFHDPNETSEDIQRLRELHDAMDRAVLEAYGWHDLAERATCEFLLDYEDDEEEDDGSAATPRSRRRKPYRYRWPDEFRDEVLARLLDLNQQRAAEERRTGAAAGKKRAVRTTPTRTKRSSKKPAPEQKEFPET